MAAVPRTKRVVLVFALVLPGCESKGLPPCSAVARWPEAREPRSPAVPRAVTETYFPAELFATQERGPARDHSSTLPEFVFAEHAAKLMDLGEAPLYPRRADGDLHAYRILYLPSLRIGGDWVARVEERRGAASIEFTHAVACESTASVAPGTDRRTRASPLPASTWAGLVRCMDQNFWTAALGEPTEDTSTTLSVHLDGTTTMIEGVRDGRYRVVSRWCLDCAGTTRSPALAECVKLVQPAF